MKVVKLVDICSTINGLWTGKKPPFEKVFVIRNTNFTKDCKLNLENVAELSVETKQLATRKLRSGDLIVEKSGGGPKQAVGRVVLFSEEGENFSLSNFTSALRIKDLSKFIPKFIQLFLFLQYISGKTETMQSNSTGIRNLNMNQFLDVEIPIPSIEKQEEIVNRLDKAFAEIDSLEKNLQLKEEKTNQLLQSMLSAAFAYTEESDVKVVKLGEVFKFQNGRAFKKGEWKESGIPIIRIQNLNSDRAGFNYFTGDYDERIMINSGDLLFSWSGTVGTSFGPHIWKGPQALLNQHIFKVQTSESIDRQYAYLSLLNITKEIENNVSGAVGLVHIKKSKLTEFLIPLPSINAQKMTVEKLDKAFSEIDKLKNQISIEKDRISSLRQSILSNAFSFPEKVS